jgi:hypothetical protein
MQIKNFGVLPNIDGLPRSNQTGKDAETESFQTRLQQYFTQSVQEAAEPKKAADIIKPADEVEAIAGRFRVQREKGGDFTDFLALTKKKEYLLAGVDIDSVLLQEGKPASLSAQQAAALREQYDTGNLPPAEQYALFQKLTELGVLSAADVKSTQFSVAPTEDDPLDYLPAEPEFRDVTSVPETKPKDRLDLMIHNERFAYNHVLSNYGQRCIAVDELADSHQKVLDTLRQI